MKPDLVWSAAAIDQIRQIEDYLLEHSSVAAGRVLNRIRVWAERLTDFPNLGPPGREPGTRELVVTGTRYVLTYRIAADRIEILAVIHGAQGWRGTAR